MYLAGEVDQPLKTSQCNFPFMVVITEGNTKLECYRSFLYASYEQIYIFFQYEFCQFDRIGVVQEYSSLIAELMQ